MTNFMQTEIGNIVKRLKKSLNIKTDSQLSIYLGLSENTITTWKQRGTFNLSLIIEKCGELDLNYIIFGTTIKSDSLNSIQSVYEITIPLYSSRVSAGNPITVSEDVESYIFPAKRFHKNTFLVGVQGDSMEGVGILDGDMLLVDTQKEPKINNIVIARVDGQLTVKTLILTDGVMFLQPENPKYKLIPVDNTTEIIGVVVSIQRDMV
ncbi:hypothetical protein EP342_01430 [bacterium]|nr:MAG: hypothetical protein EP342_01430 [bacterium]